MKGLCFQQNADSQLVDVEGVWQLEDDHFATIIVKILHQARIIKNL